MKKILLSEGLIACFFLALLLGLAGKYLGRSQKNQEVNGRLHNTEEQEGSSLVLYPGEIPEKFSPLDFSSQGAGNVLTMCFSNLLSRDEKGKKNNKQVSEPWSSDDTDFAHISAQYDEKNKMTTVTIQVNPMAKTASGKKIDADDLLFNFYLRCDASGLVEDPFDSVRISGQEEYTYGSENLAKRKKEIQEMLKKPSEELKKLLKKEIVEKTLTQEFEWVKGLYEDDSYDFISSEYQEPKDLFSYYYAYQTDYSSEEKTEQQVFSDILEQYGWDYTKLSTVTNEEYKDKAGRLALSVLLMQKGKDTVSQISGIQKKDDTTIIVQIGGDEDGVVKLCDLWILPVDEYGDRSSFDGKSNFGFQKGEAAAIMEESYQKYSGTGAYYSSKVDDMQIVLLKNPYYFGGAANIAQITIQLEEYKRDQDMVEDLLQQKADIIVARESAELDKLLANNGTGASYSIRKVGIDTSQAEDCFLYRTSYINAPSLPDDLTEYRSLFHAINQLRVNE